jgi:hypothetical protein
MPCLISIDKPMAERIDKVMRQQPASKAYEAKDSCECTRSTWPNAAILGGGNGCNPCPDKKAKTSYKKSAGSLGNSFLGAKISSLSDCIYVEMASPI